MRVVETMVPMAVQYFLQTAKTVKMAVMALMEPMAQMALI